MKNYVVLSNHESGMGRPDIIIKYPSIRGKAIIIEIKVAKSFQELDKKCKEALDQIHQQHYAVPLRQEGIRSYSSIWCSLLQKRLYGHKRRNQQAGALMLRPADFFPYWSWNFSMFYLNVNLRCLQQRAFLRTI